MPTPWDMSMDTENVQSLDAHLLFCQVCSSGDAACELGEALMAQDIALDAGADVGALIDTDGARFVSLEQHKREMHNPRDPEAEPCCTDCCSCATEVLDP